jgi:hypothetical protein
MDQEATNPEFVEMSDFDEEEGKGAGPWCLNAEGTEERQGRRVGMCGWCVHLSDRHVAV